MFYRVVGMRVYSTLIILYWYVIIFPCCVRDQIDEMESETDRCILHCQEHLFIYYLCIIFKFSKTAGKKKYLAMQKKSMLVF